MNTCRHCEHWDSGACFQHRINTAPDFACKDIKIDSAIPKGHAIVLGVVTAVLGLVQLGIYVFFGPLLSLMD